MIAFASSLDTRPADRIGGGPSRAVSDEGITLQKIVRKPQKAGQGYKFGVFGGIHGDEPAGVLAALELSRWAAEMPEELSDFELHFFPICNPTGYRQGTRCNQSGLDLNREFWSESTQPEVLYLERELTEERYDGIIALHSDDECDGCYGFVSGAVLSEHLLRPALTTAHEHLSCCPQEIIDGFAADQGIIREGYAGILSGPPNQRARPLEIVFETPALAPLAQQVEATVAAVKRMLVEYRQLQAYAANL